MSSNFPVRIPHQFQIYDLLGKLMWISFNGFLEILQRSLSISPYWVGTQYATGDQWRNNSRKNEETEPKQKQHLVVDLTGDGSKVQCCKEQYFIGTWNVRSMNQGTLEVVNQEMGRLNIDTLGISELKWTGMG